MGFAIKALLETPATRDRFAGGCLADAHLLEPSFGGAHECLRKAGWLADIAPYQLVAPLCPYLHTNKSQSLVGRRALNWCWTRHNNVTKSNVRVETFLAEIFLAKIFFEKLFLAKIFWSKIFP